MVIGLAVMKGFLPILRGRLARRKPRIEPLDPREEANLETLRERRAIKTERQHDA